MKNLVFFALKFVVILLLFTVTLVEGQEVIKTEGFGESVAMLKMSWHPGKLCIDCHILLLSEKEYREKFGTSCASCHKNSYIEESGADSKYKINTVKLSELHGTKHCIRCHVGSGQVTVMEYHKTIHGGIGCLNCHKSQDETLFNVTKPSSMSCMSCHKQIHFTHGEKLPGLCALCHGMEYASKYTSAEQTEIVYIDKTKKEEKSHAFPTLIEILSKIIEVIF